MMVRLAVVATFLTVTLGAWVVMKPPSSGPARLANGAILAPEDTSSDVEVTRSASVDPVLPAALIMPVDPALLTSTLDEILDGLGFVDAGVIAVEGSAHVAPSALTAVVVEGIEARKSDAEIAAMIEAGLASGDLAVPAALITTEGRVDAPVLLASVVTGAKARLGEEAPVPPTHVARYSVSVGDSLAAIAVHMYGDINAWTVLLEANEVLLPNPAQIEAGMQLRVPPI